MDGERGKCKETLAGKQFEPAAADMISEGAPVSHPNCPDEDGRCYKGPEDKCPQIEGGA